MKIGIMTFHGAPNHGAALQAYALQSHLQKMGHEVFFIDYQFGWRPNSGLTGWIGRNPANTFEKVNNQLRYQPFIQFQGKFLNIGSTRYIDHEQLDAQPPKAEAYICGSDQIWNPNFLKKEKDEKAFWLDFGANDVRRIAYAPSFGVDELNDDTCRRFSEYAKRFTVMSVREKNAIEMLSKLGRKDASWVPDPTLLLNQDDYLRIVQEFNGSSNSYIFSYQLKTRNSAPTPAAEINKATCSLLGLDIYETYSTSALFNLLNSRYLNPCQWLYKLYGSKFIVTNSFHCTVFSLLFHRPFITVLKKGLSAGMNGRIESLLKLVGLEHRAVAEYDRNQVEDLCQSDIDWHNIDDKIDSFRKVGQQFLVDALR